MPRPAITLLHAPSTFDFRQMTILRGPISDLVPSSSIFEMYPLGYTAFANHLEQFGYPVRIVNLAARMLHDETFDVESLIKKLASPIIFGIDLHWLAHAHGAIEIARLVKHYHPDVPILLGGFSATYYHREILHDYPEIDYILRGDSTEDALVDLLRTVANDGDLAQVPNLSWRDDRDEIRVNPLTNQPRTLDRVNYDFRRLMVSSIRDFDLESYVPFQGWLNYPIMPAVSCRGCVMNCVGCGGSASAFRLLHHRDYPVYRSPELLAEDIHKIASVSNAPAFVIGDVRQAGEDYAERFLQGLRGIRATVIIELFKPATDLFFERVSECLPNYAVEFSVESHDEEVRHAYGKPYTNEAIDQTVQAVLNHNAQRLDVFFMTGLPRQTYQSVLDTVTYAGDLLAQYGADGRVRPFIGPLAPFVDPGSRAFEDPDQHGYRLFYRTFAEHRQALLQPSWQYTLNYETHWMNRHDIVHSTYDACLRFAELKSQYNLIPVEVANRVIHTLEEGKSLALAIEHASTSGDRAYIESLRPRIEAVNGMQGVEEDLELRLANQVANRLLNNFKWPRLVWLLIKSWFLDMRHRVHTRNRTLNRDLTT